MSELTRSQLRRILVDAQIELERVSHAKYRSLENYEQLCKEEEAIENGIEEVLRQLQEFRREDEKW